MFMHVINARNVSEALAHGVAVLTGNDALKEDSRNGPVAVMPGPVTTVTLRPCERVLFSPLRHANPFFHLFESLWMLGGRNDLPWLTQFNKQMATYSDDGGKTQPAAYGHRWRQHFGYDQLELIIAELKANPETRRAVLAMWDAGTARDNEVIIGDVDLVKAINGSKDVPCNTHVYFRVRAGQLDMMVSCRSNDILWGAHGANAVHFSVLMEYVAAKVGVVVGTMYQVSFNYHLYLDIFKQEPLRFIEDVTLTDRYRWTKREPVRPTPMFHTEHMDEFDHELPLFLDWARPMPNPVTDRGKPPAMLHPFLSGVAVPMVRAWDSHKHANYPRAMSICAHEMMPQTDWSIAAFEWMARTKERHLEPRFYVKPEDYR